MKILKNLGYDLFAFLFYILVRHFIFHVGVFWEGLINVANLFIFIILGAFALSVLRIEIPPPLPNPGFPANFYIRSAHFLTLIMLVIQFLDDIYR